MKNGIDVEGVPLFNERFDLFCSQMRELKQRFRISSKTLLDDFYLSLPAYKKMENADEAEEKIQRFALMFDRDVWNPEDMDQLIQDGVVYAEALHPSLLRKRGPLPPVDSALNHPGFLSALNESFVPLIQELSDPVAIYSIVAERCYRFSQRYLEQEEKMRFDDLLQAMVKALDSAVFVKAIRHQYRAAVIDEFQDTDPVQWEIFRRLFVEAGDSWGQIYLVGDPKQSIYAFRQADIYTYLEAAQELGEDSLRSLNTNYRSQPPLVDALNALFSTSRFKGLIDLPKGKKQLDCPAVNSAPHGESFVFTDSLSPVHFVVVEGNKGRSHKKIVEEAEERAFFPFIVNEILRLHHDDNISLSEMAILVADRWQARRFALFCQKSALPVVLQRAESIVESPALGALRELIQGVLHPRNQGDLHLALGGPFFRYNHRAIEELQENPEARIPVLKRINDLRQILVGEGLAAFIHQILSECARCWLESEQGDLFYQDVLQLVDLLSAKQIQTRCSVESLVSYLDELAINPVAEEDESLKKSVDPQQQAVQLLTIHASKGLEYEVVFPLGLIRRSKELERLVPQRKGLCQVRVPVRDKQEEAYQEYSAEIDAEKIRQFYVAMTRSKKRLYVPVLQTVLEGKKGEFSPMEMYLSKVGEDVRPFLESISELSFTYVAKEEGLEAQIFEKEASPSLIPPSVPVVEGSPRSLLSFTAIATNKETHLVGHAPMEWAPLVKISHTLPAGSDTGNLLHGILEVVSFSASMEEIGLLVKKHTVGTSFGLWNEVLTQMVYDVLRIPLLDFCLADVREDKIYRETEFLYPQEKGFLKGVIDLVFAYEGRYYILDWKTNWLGDSEVCYQQEFLHEAMEAHDYYLQAKIYTEALRRYLVLVEDRPFEEVFGGVFYVFLRGPGVLHFVPANECVEV